MAGFSRLALLVAPLVLLGLAPALVAQVSLADCTFAGRQDEFLGRAARARRDAAQRVIRLATSGAARPVAAAEIPRRNFIDDEILGALATRNVPAAPLSGDEEFFRRIHLDLTGRLPDAAAIRVFVADTAQDKRDAVIDRLLDSPEFNDRWTQWMGDWLQNTSTLLNAAVNRGVPGRNAFHNYLRDAVRSDKSLATLAKEVVAAQGSTTQDATGAANFPLGASTSMGPAQDTYDTMLARTTLTFLGVSAYDCLLCHNGRGHLTLVNAWGVTKTRTEAQQLAAFFSRMRLSVNTVAEAGDGAYDLNTNSGNRPDRTPLGGNAALMPEYTDSTGSAGATPASGNWRSAFAENMVQDPMFARNAANRLWKQMFNLALVDPVDSLDPARLDPKKPPPSPWTLQATHPELLEKLAAELKRLDFKPRAFLRLLAQSSAYQLSSRFGGEWNPEHVGLFNRRLARRMEAEEVHDAIAKATGIPGDYAVQGWGDRAAWAMQLPEPLEPVSAPGVVGFLNAFLRGDRDAQERSQAGSIQQQLYLMNDAVAADRLRADRSPRLQAIAAMASNVEALDELFLTFLSRLPTERERAVAEPYFARAASRAAAVEDLAWMCVNKVEFLFSY